MSRHGNGPRRDSPGPGEEDDLCLNRVESKATVRSPRDQPIHSALNTGDQQRRIGAPTEHRAVVRKATPRVSSLMRRTTSSKARDQKVAEQMPPWGKPMPVVHLVMV